LTREMMDLEIFPDSAYVITNVRAISVSARGKVLARDETGEVGIYCVVWVNETPTLVPVPYEISYGQSKCMAIGDFEVMYMQPTYGFFRCEVVPMLDENIPNVCVLRWSIPADSHREWTDILLDAGEGNWFSGHIDVSMRTKMLVTSYYNAETCTSGYFSVDLVTGETKQNDFNGKIVLLGTNVSEIVR